LEQTDTPATLLTESVVELVALAAATAASHAEAFDTHFQRATGLGVTKEDMIQAVNIALRIKMSLHQDIINSAHASLVGGGCGCGPEGCNDESCGSGGCGDEGCGCGN
jgi:hypothetical protein